jgi:hypothetical protein
MAERKEEKKNEMSLGRERKVHAYAIVAVQVHQLGDLEEE